MKLKPGASLPTSLHWGSCGHQWENAPGMFCARFALVCVRATAQAAGQWKAAGVEDQHQGIYSRGNTSVVPGRSDSPRVMRAMLLLPSLRLPAGAVSHY